ncbi:hypothetical protein [Pseudomonas bharatica]|uniref:hypothetical protein n=1 Tax=Pseudomonas bharatica TaxID=2692112 RepID=UPI003B28AFF4
MAVTNIEMFDDITGKVFATLYQSFPIPKYLGVAEFVETPMGYSERLGMDVPTREAEFFTATAQWLINAGYITGEPYPSMYVSNALLTAKGLEVLKAIPDSLSTKASIGELLANTAQEEGKEIFRGLVGQALGLGARLISPMVGLSS